MKSKLFRAAFLASILPLLVASTCKEEIDARLFNPLYDDGDSNSPAGVISAHVRAWNDRDLGTYSSLLDDDFRFYPLSSELNDIPWMEGESWGREAELGIIAHMFDPGWSGGASAVSDVGVEAIPLSTVTQPSGDSEVTSSFSGFIRTGPTEGYEIATRVLFELDSRGGILRINAIRELPPFGSPRDDLPDMPPIRVGNSLGSVKAVYR